MDSCCLCIGSSDSAPFCSSQLILYLRLTWAAFLVVVVVVVAVVAVVVVVVVEEEVAEGVVKDGEVWWEVTILSVVGGKVDPEKMVDSVSSSSAAAVVVAACVGLAVVGAAVGGVGARVRAAWVVMVIAEVGWAVGASVAGFGTSVVE